MELKTAFNATPGALGSWRSADGDPCGWEGISCSFPDLRVQSINLPYMQLGGIISPSIGKLSKLQRLALHQNSLHGPIPLEIKNCTQLRAMYATNIVDAEEKGLGSFMLGSTPLRCSSGVPTAF